METMLILAVLGVLLYVAYSLNKMSKAQDRAHVLLSEYLKSCKTASTSSTSLNPLFSEAEIMEEKLIEEKWQQRLKRWHDDRLKIAFKEIRAHDNYGKSQSEFQPSTELKHAILNYSTSTLGCFKAPLRRIAMIEANIAIMNGEPLDDVEKAFGAAHRGIPHWERPDMDPDTYIRNDSEIKETYNAWLQNTLNSYQARWEQYVKGDYNNLRTM